jgi:pyruvate-formate lyase
MHFLLENKHKWYIKSMKLPFFLKNTKPYRKAAYAFSKSNHINVSSYHSFWKTHKAIFSRNRNKAFYKLAKSVRYQKNTNNCFFYDIDESCIFLLSKDSLSNLSVDYGVALKNPFSSIFSNQDIASAVKLMAEKAKQAIGNPNDDSYKSLDELFLRPANSLFDALQRILFINGIIWQTSHFLVGLGRLDYILDDVFSFDKNQPGYSRDKTKELVKNFLLALHSHYVLKSNSLTGDTGQIIVLGGCDDGGNYFKNDLTEIFIDELKELHIPDPKIMLRVSSSTTNDLIESALLSIETGIGSPILANDEKIVPMLISTGRSFRDSNNYVVSACWETYSYGNSTDQNNAENIDCPDLLNQLVTSKDNYISFDDILSDIEKSFKSAITNCINKANSIKYDDEPFVSCFLHDCDKNKTLAGKVGAKYNNIGILLTGFGNLVDGLLIIDKLVYKNKTYSLQELNQARLNNYIGFDRLLSDVTNVRPLFGEDEAEPEQLTNDLLAVCNDAIKDKKTPLGGVFTFGMSSPSYLTTGKTTNATFDGRRDGEPLCVHVSGKYGEPLTELINFFSSLKLPDRCSNGNVIDTMLPHGLISNHLPSMTSLVKTAISDGFFEMQFNVLSSKELIDAQKHPELYKNLIVRVWGFSTYFVSLPKDYQNLLIKRAIENEC